MTQSGYADYIPVFLSETQKLYRSGTLPCDVAMIQVSPPDAHGYVSLGTSVDATLAAVECARTVIAVINKHVPRSFGDAFIHVDDIDLFVQDDKPLEEAHFSTPNETETAIGKHCAALIEDGACLQMGIGAIPNAVLAQLTGHKDLGIHTEMFADGVLPLVESGVINGRNKAIDKGKMVSTFLMGSQKVYDFIDNNPGVAMMDVGYTNDPFVIAKNPKVTAINSALQVDLTGQICADSLGTKFYSGVGGQIDFIYGASRSEGGKAILAMPSVTNKGNQQDRPGTDPRRRRGDHPLARALVRHRIRRGQPVREIAAGACAADYQRRASGSPRSARPRGFRPLRSAPPLHQSYDENLIVPRFDPQKTAEAFISLRCFISAVASVRSGTPRSNIFGNQFPVRPPFHRRRGIGRFRQFVVRDDRTRILHQVPVRNHIQYGLSGLVVNRKDERIGRPGIIRSRDRHFPSGVVALRPEAGHLVGVEIDDRIIGHCPADHHRNMHLQTVFENPDVIIKSLMICEPPRGPPPCSPAETGNLRTPPSNPVAP